MGGTLCVLHSLGADSPVDLALLGLGAQMTIDTNKAREHAARLQKHWIRAEDHDTAAFLLALADELDRDAKDAARYRWLRDTLHNAVSGGVEVNDDALVYQECEPGEEVRLYWYPNTPVGFNEVKAATLDAAIDAVMGESNG